MFIPEGEPFAVTKLDVKWPMNVAEAVSWELLSWVYIGGVDDKLFLCIVSIVRVSAAFQCFVNEICQVFIWSKVLIGKILVAVRDVIFVAVR
jgi:hypothetical protein